MSLAVVTFWWKDAIRADRGYDFEAWNVTVLRDMVYRHLERPHSFVCVTDDTDNEFLRAAGVETLELDKSKHVPGTIYARLMMRAPWFGDVIAADQVLSLDLDVVITGRLEPLIDKYPDAESVWWKNPNWPRPGRSFFQSSVQLFTPGSHSELYDDFDPNDEAALANINRRFGGREQALISERIPWNEPHWTHEDGIYGAGRMIEDQRALGNVHTRLPVNARIVSFPGKRAPWQSEIVERHPWIRDYYK